MKNLFSILAIICLATTGFAQKNKADKFFEKGDYINATKYYEEALKKEPYKSGLENIAISYYNIFEYRKSVIYLRQLINGRFVEKGKTVDSDYYFKMYQMLSALGDYEMALGYFKQYKEQLSLTVDVTDAIATIEEFKLKNPDYTIKLMPVNSHSADFGAVKHGEMVYFTSDRETKRLFEKTYKWTHRPFLDIYKVKVNDKLDTIGSITPLPKTINGKLHDGNFCFGNDGQTLYLSRSDLTDGKKGFDSNDNNNIHLYKATLENGKWSEPEKLPFNNAEYSYQHPALSPDGSKLYFSSNQDGGFGNFDLYYVEIDGETYGKPINLGSTINTENREHFPFISEEGNLFFSSNGHLGLGLLDIFVSEKVNDSYTQPINLGAPINSKYDDFNLNYFNKTEGFFASNRNRADDDNIYSFVQTGEIFIREYINTFEIRDEATQAYVPNATVKLYDNRQQLIYNNTLDSLAFFNKSLIAGNYHLKAESPDYHSGKLNVTVLEKQNQKHVLYLRQIPPPPDPIEVIAEEKGIDKEIKNTDPELYEILTDTIGPPVVVKEGKLFFELEPIYFDFDMWNIRADSKIILDELAQKLERYPKIKIKISSHTDSRGTEHYNQILSERRAESTRNYLALEGYINARRMTFKGYGESEPVVPCPNVIDCTEDEHQLNRRSEFEIIEH